VRDEHGYLRTLEGKLWIPNNDDTLLLRQAIYASAHAGKYGGHRRQMSTMAMFDHITWPGCNKEVREWLTRCKHCLHATDRKAIPRPYGPTKRGTYPNEVVSMDHYSFGEDRKAVELIDTFTGLICVAKGPSSGVTGAKLLWRWITERDVPAFLVTDSGSHFLCEVFAYITANYSITHLPTTPYSPWSNGLVERRNRIFNNGIRSVSNELRAQKEDWFGILMSICFNINRNGSTANADLSPLEMWNGRKPAEFTDKIMVLRNTKAEFLDAAKIGDLFRTIRNDLEAQHHMVRDHHADLEVIKQLHNKNLLPNFTVGDYVLVAIPSTQHQEKSLTRWKGPYEVVGTKFNYVYEVRDLNADRVFIAHASRIIFYDFNKEDTESTSEAKLKEQAALTSDGTFFIEDLLQFDPKQGILVNWWGFDEPSWTNFEMLLEDAPTRCQEFFDTLSKIQQSQWTKLVKSTK
jgi:transposase InsO family protein